MISSLGNGLTIAINCDYLPHHDWMSFLTYWSIAKTLPDCKVLATCVRQKMNMDIFNWPRKCNVQFAYHKPMVDEELYNFIMTSPKFEKTKSLLFVKPEIIFVRDFEEANFPVEKIHDFKGISEIDGLVSDSKSENSTVCCDYSNGWGKFVTSKWINKTSIPFSRIDFSCMGMTVNENRIAGIWKSASKIYPSLSRG